MNQAEAKRFDDLYQRHLRALKLQGKAKKTIDAYARAVRRIKEYFDCCPDQLTLEQREQYFADLVESHSWSTVKLDRCGLQFFWKHVLKRDWQWVNIVKAPKVRSLPDILTVDEVERLIGATRKLRYRVFLLTTYSMGLRLAEALALQVGDIDGKRKLVHVRGKGNYLCENTSVIGKGGVCSQNDAIGCYPGNFGLDSPYCIQLRFPILKRMESLIHILCPTGTTTTIREVEMNGGEKASSYHHHPPYHLTPLRLTPFFLPLPLGV